MCVVDVEFARSTLDNEPWFMVGKDWTGAVKLLDVENTSLSAWRGQRDLKVGDEYMMGMKAKMWSDEGYEDPGMKAMA